MATWNPAGREEVMAEEDPRGVAVHPLQRSLGMSWGEISRAGVEGADFSGRPPKRQRMEDKYQAFDLEEKKLLKKYEDLESKTRKTVEATHKKLFDALSEGKMPEGINYLKKRLDSLKTKTSLDPIRIGFLGPTGAGKSSLINAIIGKELFLPVSCSSTCTSCTVQVKRSRSDFYEATIHLLSDQEWKDELKKHLEILSKTEDDDEDETSDDSVQEASFMLHALYGPGAEKKSYEDLLKVKLKVTLPTKRRIQIKEKEGKEFSAKLGSYVRVWNEGSSVLWPLVKYVEVTVPGSDMLPDGITFVDIPGTGDFNSKRDEMWKASIATCSVLWIISDIGRAVGEKVQGLLLEESIKAYVGGICTDFALVVTKSDNLNLKAYISERGNRDTPIENEHDAILERNETVKRKKEGSIKEKLKRKLPPDSEIFNKPNLVYTVSANEFCDGKHLSQEETEIPKLRDYIREIYLNEKKKLVTEFVTDAYGIHQLAENFGSEEHLVEQHFQESGVEEFVNKEIDALRKSLEKCVNEIEQPLCAGVENARKSYRKIVNVFLTKENGYRGYHKTLKAVCLKNGVYASKTFVRIDFNEDLAKPIYEKIDKHFGSMFRIQQSTRQSLWSQLEAFKNEVKKKINEIGENKLPKSKIDTCTHENEVVLMKLKKEILRRKTVIYGTLPLSIQNDLRPHYEEASKVKGSKSCEQMKTILRESVEKEVMDKMFEKAKSKMKSYLLDLTETIVKMLKKETSILLKLALLQQDRLAVKLPDIERECRTMKQLYESLKTNN